MPELTESDINRILNTFNEGACYLQAQGNLLYYNSAALRHWRIEPSSPDALTRQPLIARALKGERLHHELVHLDEQRTLLINAQPLFDRYNVLLGAIITSQDVSESASLEREAQVTLDVLLDAIQSTSDFQNIDESLKHIAALIPRLEAVDNSFALRVDIASGRIIPLALFGESQHNYEDWRAELSAIELNTSQAVQAKPMAFVQAIRLARPLQLDFSVETTLNNPYKTRAAIYAPVFMQGQVVGLLGAERHRPIEPAVEYFPQWSVSLLTALARVATMSIEKQHLISSVDKLRGEEEQLRALVKQKEEFLLIASHELKNPITTILGMAQVLRRRIERLVHHEPTSLQETHQLMRGLESIENQARRSTHIINTLLDANRSDLEHLDVELEELDILQFVRRVVRDYRFLASRHELRLVLNGKQIDIGEDEQNTTTPIIIQGDEQRLEHVLVNLLSNAVKYSPEHTLITISVQNADNHIQISVEDQGIGIPVEAQARLAERFYRADNAQNTKGLGIGLYLVQTVIARHGGRFFVKSEGIPGKGSIFSILLPKQGG